MRERHGAPNKRTRSIHCTSSIKVSPPQLPVGLVGPSAQVPVQIEGIYAKALLDSGSQVTILYRSFYDAYLKHLPIQPLENLEIWGLSSHRYPYDGYLSLKLEFTEAVAGVHQVVDTLALVCPDPLAKGGIAILVGTNTQLVKKLFECCQEHGGEGFISTLQVHPLIREAFESCKASLVAPKDLEKHGTVWYTKRKPAILKPGQVLQVPGLPKFPGPIKDSLVLVDQVCADDDVSSLELQVRPEVHPVAAVFSRHITVTMQNISSRDVVVKRGSPLAHIFPVDVVSQIPLSGSMRSVGELSPAAFDFGASPMPEEAKLRLCEKMMQRKEVFSCHEWDLGCSKSTLHEIRLTDPRPFRERSRRLAPADWEDVRQHLQDLQRNGIIAESRSPYASPIVVVRKKSGKVRMCVDYRTLNQRTIPDQYTVPRIEDALHCLSGSKWFTVLDLRSGYYQVPMSDADKEKTAFICPLGFYQFERMPQGICGAPATFQRVMERTVGDMNFLEALVYLDDLIVFGHTLEEHEERLLKVLDRLRAEGLKISLDKCQFGQASVNYVGHIVSQDGVATDPSKIEAVVSWPRPQTVTELRSFLGFCGYYRRFVKGFSTLCRPLNELLKGSLRPGVKPSEPFGSQWSEQCEAAFQELKGKLTQAPVLAFADAQKPYVLHVDASYDGLGGVLYQEHDGDLRPVAFVSRSLSPSERNYPAHKLEFLALKWAIVDRLHDYLYGVNFEVRTDNNPLTYITKSAKLDATGHRWLSALSTYTFSLKYRPGRKNVDADALSRRPHSSHPSDDEWLEIPAPGVRALCQAVSVKGVGSGSPCFVEMVGCNVSAVPEAYCHATTLVTEQLPVFNIDEIQDAQKKDPYIGEIWEVISQKRPVNSIRLGNAETRVLKREWEKLSVDKGLLYRTVKFGDRQVRQLVLPKQFHHFVLKSLHDDIGHLGFDKSYSLVRDRFFWPRMKLDVEKYCKTCERCIKRKTLPQKAAPLSHMQSSGPLDLVCIDFLSIEPDSRNVGNVLVVTDHFTRYAQAFPTPDQKACTVAKTLWDKYFIHYGLPSRIHSDQGRDFESKLVTEMLTVLGVKKSRTSPYHPQGDPQPERFNRTLLDMLGTLDSLQKSKWSQHITHLVHAYNCTPNEATGYSPYYLMFGREARLPIDVCFGASADDTSSSSHLKYVTRLKQSLHAAYQLAKASADKMNQSNKERYDQKVRYHRLSPGDRVLIRNLGLTGKHKLADRWGSCPYIVDSQLSDLPVYRLKSMDSPGRVKVMHRNHILPLAQDVRLSPVVEHTDVPRPRAIRPRKEKGKCQVSEPEPLHPQVNAQNDGDVSESESEFGCYVEDQPPPQPNKAVPSASEVPSTSIPCHLPTPAQTDHIETEIPVDLPETVEIVEDSVPVNQDVCISDVQPVASTVSSSEVVRRSNRERKPPARLTFDEPGGPAKDYLVGSKCCGVHLMTATNFSFPAKYNRSHAWWCNFHALCNTCMQKGFSCPLPYIHCPG